MSTAETKRPFSIKTGVFEGPLELLLDLVEKRKFLINDISIAAVTDEYMRHVALMQERSLTDTTQFVQLAATLLLIKSKSLLPVLDLTHEEEESIEDLEGRLRLYQIYRNASKLLQEQFGVTVSHGRQYAYKGKVLFIPDAYTTSNALRDAIFRVVEELPKKQEKPHVQVKSIVSLEEMIERLHARIQSHMKVSFRDLLQGDSERTTVIVGFLAILESVKQGSILVVQAQRFQDIEIEKDSVAIPRYQ